MSREKNQKEEVVVNQKESPVSFARRELNLRPDYVQTEAMHLGMKHSVTEPDEDSDLPGENDGDLPGEHEEDVGEVKSSHFRTIAGFLAAITATLAFGPAYTALLALQLQSWAVGVFTVATFVTLLSVFGLRLVGLGPKKTKKLKVRAKRSRR